MRSALETWALLFYLNHKIDRTVFGKLSFLEFEETSKRLLMGSKDKSTPLEAFNVLTALKEADKKYSGLEQMYAEFSEAAHPNYAGVIAAYSSVDTVAFETHFHACVADKLTAILPPAAAYVFEVFDLEYNDTARLLQALEDWLEANDAELERLRSERES